MRITAPVEQIPDTDIMRQIISALRACEARLPPEQFRMLKFTLRAYGGLV